MFEATGRTKDETPAAVAFATKSGQTAGAAVLSDIVQLRDHDGVSVSVSGGSSYRVCSDSSCSGNEAFTSAAGTATTNSWIQLRQTAPASGQGQNVSLTYGTLSAVWRVESAAPPSASCPGAYMRAKSPYGFEALFCGWSAAPKLTQVGYANAAGYEFIMSTRETSGCEYGTSIVPTGPLNTPFSTTASGGSRLSSCPDRPFPEVFQSIAGVPLPVTVIIISKGTLPSSWVWADPSTTTWSK